VTVTAQTAVFRVAGEMTIYRAAELKQEILAQLDQHALLEFDLSEVSEIDSAGLQLLFLAASTAAARQGVACIGPRSAAVREVFAILGLDSRFPDPARTVSQHS